MSKIPDLGQELIAYRERNNYSQKELSGILNISQKTMSRYELGETYPSAEIEQIIYELMPYLKTGNKLECVYDYVRVRIKKASPQDVIKKILGLRYEFFLEEATNILHYNTMLSLDGIKILFDQPDLMKGVLIELTGNGCRQFESFLEQQERSWYSFFSTCLKFGANLTRLDLAINDYYRFLSIPKLARKIEDGECLTGFRSYSTEAGGSFDGNQESRGTTIYFGARSSNLHLCFYEKDYEQSKKLKVPRDMIPIKNRYEMRFAHEYADEALEKCMATGDELQVAKNLLSTYVSFRDRADTNRKYWPLNPEWSVFLGEVEATRIHLEPKTDFYDRSVNHMAFQYGGVLKMVRILDDTLGIDSLDQIVENAEMSEKHEKMLKVKLADLTDIVI